jgi:hypothetical protein
MLLITIGSGFTMANGGTVLIQKQQWSKYSKGYDYTEKIKKPETRKPKDSKHFKLGSPFLFFTGAWLKFLLWGIVIVVLLVLTAWLIINILRGNTEKVASNKTFTSLSVDDIEEADLEYFLDQSLTSGSFKDAIRIRYLMLIRTLSRLNMVIWKKDKTNGSYVNEMHGKAGFEHFRQLTISFERAWYGDKEIGEIEYRAIMPVFDQLNKIVTPNE